MKKSILKYYILTSSIRLLPHLIILLIHRDREIIFADIEIWAKWKSYKDNRWYNFLHLMTIHDEFRNIFYRRIGHVSCLIKWLCPQLSTLYIQTNKIGKGFRIHHGFSTIITAESIGENVSINQQVTIGHGNNGKPTIGNNVSINSGAIIVGGITIGDNCIIGAGTVVTKNIEKNCVVVGGPAYIVRKNDLRISKQELT